MCSIGVYPNPSLGGRSERLSQLDRRVTFNNLPPKAVILMFDLAGQLVRMLEKTGPSPFLDWDPMNEVKRLAANSTYVAHAELLNFEGSKVLKLTAIQEQS